MLVEGVLWATGRKGTDYSTLFDVGFLFRQVLLLDLVSVKFLGKRLVRSSCPTRIVLDLTFVSHTLSVSSQCPSLMYITQFPAPMRCSARVHTAQHNLCYMIQERVDRFN